MNLVEWLQHLMTNLGAAWVMWLLIGLSVLSVAIGLSVLLWCQPPRASAPEAISIISRVMVA